MKITLDANPSDAPCSVKIVAADGRDRLIQMDWDWPGVAANFGFSLRSIQRCQRCGHTLAVAPNCKQFDCNGVCDDLIGQCCQHSGTDGTIDCKDCGLQAGDFIAAAREWMDNNDGAEADDPGYFEES